MPEETLTITDNRTGKSYTVPLFQGTLRAMELRHIKTDGDDFGLMTYDPAFLNTASCESAITFIDGDRGILEYRGYPIEDLAEHCTFPEVAYLIIHGELPTEEQYNEWTARICRHTLLHESTKKFMEGFRYNAHPMGMLVSTVAALSTVYPEAKEVHDPTNRMKQMVRLIAKMPSLSAYSYRHAFGRYYVYPDSDLGYIENYMNMLWRRVEPKYVANPILARALDLLFTLHADHEQNCSTNVMRAVGSAMADPYLCVSAAAAALSGPLHGGANQEVLQMLDLIGTKSNISRFIQEVKEGRRRLMGFGHRVYKNYDPRARIVKRTADEVFEVTGINPRLEIALELEKIALNDDYFIKRRLYPNVDFYSGIIFQAMGFQPDMFTVLFAIPRTVGWLAQWQEMLEDPEQKIARPRQIYIGHARRQVVPRRQRAAAPVPTTV